MNPCRHVLVVDDEPDLLELIALNLASAGYRVSSVPDGLAALAVIENDKPDIIVLDRMMPKLDGIELAKRIRIDLKTASIPILMLTARSTEADELTGLAAGVDDYITKPFSMAVLRARIEALLRRAEASAGAEPKRLTLGPIVLDGATHEARVGGAPITLTLTEFRILASLIAARDRVLSRKALIAQAIGPGISVTTRTIDVHVTAIRRKLGEAGALIHTVRGVGYRAHEESNSSPIEPAP